MALDLFWFPDSLTICDDGAAFCRNPHLKHIFHWKLQQQPYNKEVSGWFYFSIFLILVLGVQQSSSKYIVVCAPLPTLVVPFPTSFSPLVSAGLFSVSESVSVLLYSFTCFIFQIPYTSGDIQVVVFVFLCLIYFTKHSTLRVHSCCCKWQNFILFMAK